MTNEGDLITQLLVDLYQFKPICLARVANGASVVTIRGTSCLVTAFDERRLTFNLKPKPLTLAMTVPLTNNMTVNEDAGDNFTTHAALISSIARDMKNGGPLWRKLTRSHRPYIHGVITKEKKLLFSVVNRDFTYDVYTYDGEHIELWSVQNFVSLTTTTRR